MKEFDEQLSRDFKIAEIANPQIKRNINRMIAKLALEAGFDKDTVSKMYKIPKSEL